MISLHIVLLIIAIHWVADFVLQSTKMATTKSKRLLPLLAHVGTYLLVLSVMTQMWSWCLLNAALHFMTDYVTSRITSRLWAANRTHDFFTVIGLDQLIHYTCLLGTFVWMYPA